MLLSLAAAPNRHDERGNQMTKDIQDKIKIAKAFSSVNHLEIRMLWMHRIHMLTLGVISE